MTNIPSSLKWLVNRRARIKGLVDANEHELQRLVKIQQRLPELKLDLEALDRLLRLHEIPIDGTTIPAIRPIADFRIRMKKWFRYGELTSFILVTLANCKEDSMTTKELSQAMLVKIGSKFPEEEIDRIVAKRVHELVHKRLKTLCKAGRIRRLKPARDAMIKACVQEWALSTTLI